MKNCISITRNCHSHIHESTHFILFALLKVHLRFFFYLVWLVGPLNSWPPGRRPLSVGLHISHHAPNKYDRERKLLWWMRLVMMQDIRSDWGDALDDKKDWNESFKPSSGSLILTIDTFSWQRCWQQSISFNRLEVSTFFILYFSIK
jgi:hypothetical protein